MKTTTMKEKIEEQEKEINTRKKLIEMFPDLHEYKDRWDHVYLCSKDVNPIADDVFINHNCGCCEDSSVQAWPFKEFFETNVFSDPACFTVGEKVSCYFGEGERPWDNWEQKLIEAGIRQLVIDKVRDFFEQNKPKRYELVDDDDFEEN